MKAFLPLFALIIVVLYNGTGCKDDCAKENLEFDLPLKAYGIKDSLRIGDTIRIRLDIPDKMPERTSGYLYDFIDYDFKLITYIPRIDTFPLVSDISSNFDWMSVDGESVRKGGSLLVFPRYSNNTYQYEFIIIAKQKGIFEFSMQSNDFGYSPLAQLTGPCSKLPVSVYMKLENDTNVNFEYLKESPDIAAYHTIRKDFDERAGFCFYVW